jgi:hypothetical protein
MSVKHSRIRRKPARRLNILLTLILLVLILLVGICSLFRSPEQKGSAVPPVSEDASAQAQSEAEAEALMLQVHHSDKAVVGIYSYDIAVSKVAKATQMARNEGFPLRLTYEPE